MDLLVDVAPLSGAIMDMEVAGQFEVIKSASRPAELHLHVVGVHRASAQKRIYRVSTRDGQYIGRTNPTTVRAVKGDRLKIQANHFGVDDSGNIQWSNPNVISHYSDRAHSWKDLEALAGGAIVKDGAPGPAGDIPPAQDEGIVTTPPSGPTLAAVHIPAPMPSISVAYAGRSLVGRKIKVHKAEKDQQLVYGVVLESNVLDSQNDFMLPRQVEAAAHNYLKKAIRGKASVAKLQHRKQGFFKEKPSVVPVQSFIAPVDFSYDGKEMVKAGTWVMVMHVEDPGLWEKFLSGEYTGFSVGGSGLRQSYTAGDDEVPHGLINGNPDDWTPDLPGMGVFG